MRRHQMEKLGTIAALVLMLGAASASQEKPKAAQQPVAAADAVTAPLLRVQITLARYQGEKKVSSAPYTLLMNADGSRGGVRIGAQVPVPVASGGGSADRPAATVQYRDIGTFIDCSAKPVGNGLYQMELSIEDVSVYGDEPHQAGAAKGAVPSFRVFRASHKFGAREGQLTHFTGATDRASGDVVRVELTFSTVS